jgi:hypothetical protein
VNRNMVALLKVSHKNGSGSCAVNGKKGEPSRFEKKLMLAMGPTSVDQLDELLAAPISPWAADHSESPDEEYALADRMNEEADRQMDVQNRFNALAECKYLC